MIVQSGQLIDAGRRFPAEDFAGVASAKKCFVGKPVEFPGASKISQLEVVGLGGLRLPHDEGQCPRNQDRERKTGC